MLIGYARVSTAEQNLDLQTDALKRAGCEKLFTDTSTGARSETPGATMSVGKVRTSSRSSARGREEVHDGDRRRPSGEPFDHR